MGRFKKKKKKKGSQNYKTFVFTTVKAKVLIVFHGFLFEEHVKCNKDARYKIKGSNLIA